jgi:hypothetical protein
MDSWMSVRGMEIFSLRLKFLTDWVINKKEQILALMENHCSINMSLYKFSLSYLSHLNEIMAMIHSNLKGFSRNSHDPNSTSFMQLFSLMKQKEETNVEQWRNMVKVL